MNRNIEIKARLPPSHRHAVLAAAQRLADGGETVLHQSDTFFNCARGRLKLRQVTDRSGGELIFYQRSDEAGPKCSKYWKTEVADPSAMVMLLSEAYGIHGVVKKRRLLYMIGQTRVHVDCVENLGEFVEFEVVLKAEQTELQGQQIADALMLQLGLTNDMLISGAYMDLLLQQKSD